jgi:hypothetical protein
MIFNVALTSFDLFRPAAHVALGLGFPGYSQELSQGCPLPSPWHSLICSGVHFEGLLLNLPGCSQPFLRIDSTLLSKLVFWVSI